MEPTPTSIAVFDLQPYLENKDPENQSVIELCRSVATHLKESGVLVVRDPRVDASKNNRFLDAMEKYFGRPLDQKMADARPHLAYQVGITPEGVERPRCLNDESIQRQIAAYSPDSRPKDPIGPDPKWRYFWRLGERPTETRFKELNADPVIPREFDDWEEIMNDWGSHMLTTVASVSEMIAIGFGLDRDTFTQRMHYGPHLLAPTGTDLEKHGSVGTVFAGFHNDLNFLTIHGKSRFPGLFIWLRNGKKLPVRIPDGCLLIQAGKQMEWLTGGVVEAGFHEVICTEGTIQAREEARQKGKSLWRVSSTVFSQLASDELLRPLSQFATPESVQEYPAMPVGKFVESELRFINLMNSSSSEKCD